MSKITKKQLHNGWHCHDMEIVKMKKELRELKRSVLRLEKLTDEKPPDEPPLKHLDQSVFDGLDSYYMFAAIDGCTGRAYAYEQKPHVPLGKDYWRVHDGMQHPVEHGYDTTNWQNSLIERDIAKEPTGSDLCRKMLARGDKCVLIRMGVRDDKQAKDIGRFAIATSIDESGRFNVMSDQQPISKVNFAVPINNQGEPLTQAEAGL